MINWNGLGSLLLACMEFILLLNLLIFSEKNKINFLGIILVGILAVYQALEFLMCALNLKYSYMAYLAFLDISFLPPLNLYFILKYFRRNHKLNKALFIPALAFAVYYYLVMDKFAVVSCSVLYASYSYPLGSFYGFFYYAPVVYAIIFLCIRIRQTNDETKKKLSKILLGGLLFVSLPVIAAFILLAFHNDKLLAVTESIMCKFAFVYAVCLGYFTLINKKAVYE
ncbi:MAG: hypothetical protein ABR980_03580 [Ignavibacteriaceae bacterium]